MPLPSSGPISFGDINEEAHLTRNTANTILAGGSTPQVGSLVKLYEATVNQSAPHALSEFRGVYYDAVSTTLEVKYETNYFYANIYDYINSTTITISAASLSVIGYDDGSCSSPSGESDTSPNALVINGGSLNASQQGNYGMTCTTTYYKFSGNLVINGTSRYDGEQFYIGSTYVTLSFPQSCAPYFC